MWALRCIRVAVRPQPFGCSSDPPAAPLPDAPCCWAAASSRSAHFSCRSWEGRKREVCRAGGGASKHASMAQQQQSGRQARGLLANSPSPWTCAQRWPTQRVCKVGTHQRINEVKGLLARVKVQAQERVTLGAGAAGKTQDGGGGRHGPSSVPRAWFPGVPRAPYSMLAKLSWGTSAPLTLRRGAQRCASCPPPAPHTRCAYLGES